MHEVAPRSGELDEATTNLIQTALIVSSAAVEQKDARTGRVKLVGANQTSCALVMWALTLKPIDMTSFREEPKHRITKQYPFHSALKRSGVLLHYTDTSYCFILKGAPERILGLCTKVWINGESNEMTKEIKEDVATHIAGMTQHGLRCIGVCFKDVPMDSVEFKDEKLIDDPEINPDYWLGFTWIALAGIKDPVRTEVPKAVAAVQKAGVVVRMVTGDHLETAKFIARECGILTAKHHVAMLGSDFRELTVEQKNEVLPNLRVLARSNPKDKQELVRWYKESHSSDRKSKTVEDNIEEQ